MFEQHRYVKLADEHAEPAARRKVAREALELAAKIPGVAAAIVGTPADEASARSWDLALTLRLERREDLEALAGRAEYRALAEGFLAPRSVVSKVWSFATEGRGG